MPITVTELMNWFSESQAYKIEELLRVVREARTMTYAVHFRTLDNTLFPHSDENSKCEIRNGDTHSSRK
jgi:hypothetical protein